MKKFSIIVAGGKGQRMGSDLPKQFLMLKGKPVLMRTLEIFSDYDPSMKIILALPENYIPHWKELCSKYHFNKAVSIVAGGETRYHSVKNALEIIEEEGIVAVHDGVRPLITSPLIDRCFRATEKFKNAIPCIPVSESMREVNGDKNHRVDRSKYVLIQTPQVFEVQLLKEAFRQSYRDEFTDEASLIETLSIPVHLVEGIPHNIKITNRADLVFAEAILREG
jgi:2-C-methyl-D-erythritol 4-phosphate cytidylyltransferase